MTGCLSENLIVEFFSDDRSPEVAAEVDEHAAGCEACRQLLAEYAQLSANTAATYVDAMSDIGSTPARANPTGAKIDVELVQRLALARSRKRVGTLLKGKWEVDELLGAGGMAQVFAARHRNGRRVAIKFMRAELTTEPALVERFLREGYVANKIEHPGAVTILDDDIAEDGTPFLVMELLVGETLRKRLERGPLPVAEALRVIAEMLDVLAVAHEKGIVHRDLKPDNLFQTESGAIKVLDFGIARLMDHARSEFDTRSGTTLGTVGYMPPEQARGLTAEVDARSDVWAVGATLYALLTGHPVHRAATKNETLLLAMTKPVPPTKETLPHLPAEVHAVLDRALAFEKDARYPSARAMSVALAAVRDRLPDALGRTSAVDGAHERKGGRVTRSVLAIGGAAVLGVGALFFFFAPTKTAPATAAPIAVGTDSGASSSATSEAKIEEAAPAESIAEAAALSAPQATATAARTPPPPRASKPSVVRTTKSPAPPDTRDPLGPRR